MIDGEAYERRFLSPDNRLYCDVDGQDIMIRDCVSGKKLRRARQAIPTGKLPECLAVGPGGEMIYLRPQWRGGTEDRNLWRWPTVAE